MVLFEYLPRLENKPSARPETKQGLHLNDAECATLVNRPYTGQVIQLLSPSSNQCCLTVHLIGLSLFVLPTEVIPVLVLTG